MKTIHKSIIKIILGFTAFMAFIYFTFKSPDEVDFKVSLQKQEITFHKSRSVSIHQLADTLHRKQ